MFRQNINFARKLRKNQTPHEDRLWFFLKDRRLLGYKFRRQHVIETFIVDFICAEKKLIIELDGSGHLAIEAKDFERDQYLQQRGYQVVRVWNSEIEENLEGVLEDITQKLSSPSPQPSPQKGEGMTIGVAQ